MPEVFYTAPYIAGRAGRSRQTARGWYLTLPDPDVILRGELRPQAAWSAENFRKWAETRREPLRTDVLKALDEDEADKEQYIKQVLDPRLRQ